jgi:hypothetical protein
MTERCGLYYHICSLFPFLDRVFDITVPNLCGKMPSSIDILSGTCYKSNPFMCNEIPHYINACQKFNPSDILPHFLLHLLIWAIRTLFPIKYLILCHLVYCVRLNISFHQFLYYFTELVG